MSDPQQDGWTAADLPDQADLETVVEIAEAAGQVLLEWRRRGFDVDTKSSAVDPVTQADRESEALVVEALQRRWPADAVLGEEGANRPGTSGRRWVVDPLDGTVNYVYGRDEFAVSIGLVGADGRGLLGVVHAPALGRTVAALAPELAAPPAELRLRAPAPLAQCLVSTGFSYDARLRAEQIALIAPLVPQVRDLRRGGSAAWDLVLVALGHTDLHLETTLNPWDIAAGMVLVEAAGGTIRTWQQFPGYTAILAGHADRVTEVAALLAH